MIQSDYAYRIEGQYLIILDLNLGRMSVTNDIENVLNEISNKINNPLDSFKIIYEDSDGMIDGVLTYNNEFSDYYILGTWDIDEAKLKFDEYYSSMSKKEKIKVLKLIIKNCGDCPYCEYDIHYDLSSNTGWNCNKGLGRIISDVDDEMTDISQIPIPDNCPLPNK